MNVHCLYLAITAQCNLKCRYCYQNVRSGRRLEWESLRAGIDLVLKENPYRTDVLFSGGEPLLEFELVRRCVEYAERLDPEKKRIIFLILTNGLLISKTVADFLDEHAINIQLSFDGVRAAQDYRGEGTFEALDRILDQLRLEHPALFNHCLKVSITVTVPTIQYMAESVEYLIGKGVREIRLGADFFPFQEWKADDGDLLNSQFAKIADLCRKTMDQNGHVPVTAFRKYVEDKRPRRWPLPCGGLTGGILTLDADGLAYTCAMFARSCQEFPQDSFMTQLDPLVLGDIRSPEFHRRLSALSEALHDRQLLDFRAGLHSSHGRCDKCEYLGRCYICPATLWHGSSATSLNRVPDFICNFNRLALKNRDEFPCLPKPSGNAAPGGEGR